MAVLDASVTKVTKDESTGFYEIHTDDSNVKKLTTRNEAPAKAAAALRRDGTRARLTYTHKRNEREDGRVFNNYYLDKAEPAPSMNGSSADDDGIEHVSPTRKTDPGDAWRMCLNKGGELAVLTMPMMPTEQRDFETQKRIATAWARFFFFTPAPDRDTFAVEPAGASAGPGAYNDPDSYELPPPPTDDDIPF